MTSQLCINAMFVSLIEIIPIHYPIGIAIKGDVMLALAHAYCSYCSTPVSYHTMR